MKKSNLNLLIVFMFALAILPFALNPAFHNMFSTATEILGMGFWIRVLGFVVFIIALIVVLKRWLLKSVNAKDIPNGQPAIATVIRSYQGNMAMKYGVHQYYTVIIEADITNPIGETWFAKVEQLLPITQVGIFQPGVRFAVKYDPKNKNKVIIDQSAQTLYKIKSQPL